MYCLFVLYVYSSIARCNVQFEEVLNFSKLASLLFGTDSNQTTSNIIYDVERQIDFNSDSYSKVCLDPELVKWQIKQLLKSPTFQTEIQRIFKDVHHKKQKRISNTSEIDKHSKGRVLSVPKSKNNMKVVRRAKMKAKSRIAGFRSSIYFQSNSLIDNSRIKMLNDECNKEIKGCLRNDFLKLTQDKSSYSPKRPNSNRKYIPIRERAQNGGGHITRCIEAACNGNDDIIIFESTVTAAVVNHDDRLISEMKESIISLTPKHILIKTQDISKSVKISNFDIQEISIDELQQIIIIDNSIRLSSFITNSHLQRFLVLLEYLIRKNANQICNDSGENVTKLMRPLLWNDLLRCKERVLFLDIDAKINWYIYASQNPEEVEEETSDRTFLTRNRNETKILANFKIFGCCDLPVMEVSNQESNDLHFAYFEVK